MKNSTAVEKDKLDLSNISQLAYNEGRWAIWTLIFAATFILEWYFQGLITEISSETGYVFSEYFLFIPKWIFILVDILAFVICIYSHAKRYELINSLSADMRIEAIKVLGDHANPGAFMVGEFAFILPFKKPSAS